MKNQTKPTLVILAAGMGSRYGGLKQVDPVGPNGESLLDYAIYDAIRANFGKIVFVISKRIEDEFKRNVGTRYNDSIEVDYAFQELNAIPKDCVVPDSRLKPWGTGHAVMVAETIVTEPFAVINADDYYGPASYVKLHEALSSSQKETPELFMIGFHVEKTLSEFGKVSRGVCSLTNGHLNSVIEREAIQKKGDIILFEDNNNLTGHIPEGILVSMNCWGFIPELVFPILRDQFKEFMRSRSEEAGAEFYLPAAINMAVKKKKIKVKVLETSESWFGLTYSGDKIAAQDNIQQMIESGLYPEKLF